MRLTSRHKHRLCRCQVFLPCYLPERTMSATPRARAMGFAGPLALTTRPSSSEFEASCSKSSRPLKRTETRPVHAERRERQGFVQHRSRRITHSSSSAPSLPRAFSLDTTKSCRASSEVNAAASFLPSTSGASAIFSGLAAVVSPSPAG